MKKSFALILTISLVIVFSVSALFIIENKAMNNSIDTSQIGYTQALYHMKFCKEVLIQKIDIDPSITSKILFENIQNHKVEAIIDQIDSKTLQIDLSVESLLYKNIRLHQKFLKSLI